MAKTANIPIYQRLNAQEFRLLQVSNDAATSTLSIHLKTVSLDNIPEYRAVSYVWGPQEPSIPVSCAGEIFKVGLNLGSLLERLASEGCREWLFVDRMCINQEDLPERKQQVMLMGEIYKTAQSVIVWLGNSNPTYKLAFDTITHLRDELNRQIREDHRNKIKHGSGGRFDWPTYSSPGADAIRQLLTAEWFSRMWTFQELVLGTDATFKSGENELPWSALNFLLVCYRTSYKPGPNHDDEFLAGTERHAVELIKLRMYLPEPEGIAKSLLIATTTLPALLSQLRGYHATDPRDKVFALLSVASDNKVASDKIQPDYEQSVLEVYAKTVKWIMTEYKNLSFLGMVEQKEKPDLVSWVPDFRSRDGLNFSHQPALIFPGAEERWWNASGASEAMTFNIDTPLLNLPVRTIRIGKVTGRTNPADNHHGKNILGSRVLDGGEWQLFAEETTLANNGIYRPTGEAIHLAFQRLRIWDSLPNEANQRRFRKKALTPGDSPKISPLESSENIKGLLTGPADDIGSRILVGTGRKRMFRTNSGYLGLANRCLQVGDEIHVLMGFHIPCVLRKLGGTLYSFAGEAYVHGAMDGEVLLREAGRVSHDDAINGLSDDDREWLANLAGQDMGAALPKSESIILV